MYIQRLGMDSLMRWGLLQIGPRGSLRTGLSAVRVGSSAFGWEVLADGVVGSSSRVFVQIVSRSSMFGGSALFLDKEFSGVVGMARVHCGSFLFMHGYSWPGGFFRKLRFYCLLVQQFWRRFWSSRGGWLYNVGLGSLRGRCLTLFMVFGGWPNRTLVRELEGVGHSMVSVVESCLGVSQLFRGSLVVGNLFRGRRCGAFLGAVGFSGGHLWRVSMSRGLSCSVFLRGLSFGLGKLKRLFLMSRGSLGVDLLTLVSERVFVFFFNIVFRCVYTVLLGFLEYFLGLWLRSKFFMGLSLTFLLRCFVSFVGDPGIGVLQEEVVLGIGLVRVVEWLMMHCVGRGWIQEGGS